MRIAVLNGPNLNMLGIREPDIYGRADYASLVETIEANARENRAEVLVAQTNSEGGLVGMIQRCLGRADGIVINPAAYTHTSVAVLDALKAVALPAVEVHLSDVSAREDFRHLSYAGQACAKTFAGLGFAGYLRAVDWMLENVSPREAYTGALSEVAEGERPRIARFERLPDRPDVLLPRRATAGSAGYDFFAPATIALAPGEGTTVDTGVRCWMDPRYVLLLLPRSSLGFKYRLALDNTVGVIDADYYFADNLGHIRIRMTNGGDKPLTIEKGQAFAQGVFVPYGLTEDDEADGRRTGGFGSTDKR